MSLTIELSPEAEEALKRQAESRGLSLEDYARQRLSAASTEVDAPTPEAEPEERPIWEEIAEIMEDVPDEEFAKLPRDGASQVDHYLYGHPKR